MITKFIVFGQTHTHPQTNARLKDYMVKIQAPTGQIAQMFAIHKYGINNFSRLIDVPDHTMFPGGILETVIVDYKTYEGETSRELVGKKTYDTISEPEPLKQKPAEDGNKRRIRSESGEAGRTTGEAEDTSDEPQDEAEDKSGDQQDRSWLS